MVKKLLSFILSIVIISQSMVYVAIGVYYHVNKEYISQKLCENRNNPAMHCNGHCYLSKQLKNAEQGENKAAQVIKEQDEVLTNEFEGLSVNYYPAYSEIKPVQFNIHLYYWSDARSLIKPPAA